MMKSIWFHSIRVGIKTHLLLAVTHVWSNANNEIVHFDIEINADDVYWSTTGDPNKHDLHNTMTHEFGHALGLEHSDETQASMSSTTSMGELTKRDVHDDDIQGFLTLYPFQEGSGNDGSDPNSAAEDDNNGSSGGGSGVDNAIIPSAGGGGGSAPALVLKMRVGSQSSSSRKLKPGVDGPDCHLTAQPIVVLTTNLPTYQLWMMIIYSPTSLRRPPIHISSVLTILKPLLHTYLVGVPYTFHGSCPLLHL